MILYICGHDFHYEMENLCRVFFPNEKITVSDTLPESGAPEVETYLDGASGGYSVRVRVNVGDKTETRSAEVPKTDEPEKDECERTMARELFSALSAVTGYVPPWGILTGVRPSKLMLKLIESLGEKGAYDYFTKSFLSASQSAPCAERRGHGAGDSRPRRRALVQSLYRDTVLPVKVQLLLVRLPFDNQRQRRKASARLC